MTAIERTLTFRIDACPESPLIAGSPRLARGVASACIHDPAVDGFRREVADRFGLKGPTWTEVTLGVSARPFLDFMAERARAGFARFGSGFLDERPAARADADWYRIAPPLRYSDRWRKASPVDVLARSGASWRRAASAWRSRPPASGG